MRAIAVVLMLPPPATARPSTHPAAIPGSSGGSGTKRSSGSSQSSTVKIVKLLIWDDKHPTAVAAAAAAVAAAAEAAAEPEAAAGAGAAPPPAAAAVVGGVPTNAHSTDAADAAARATAKQLHQLPSLALVDDPVCVCPPGKDWDGLLGALSLSGSLSWNRGPTAGLARGVTGSAIAGQGRGVVGRAAAQSRVPGGRQETAPTVQQHQQGSGQQVQQTQQTPVQHMHRSPVKSGCSGAGQHTPPSTAAAAAAAGDGFSGPDSQPCCTCGSSPLQLQYYASELSLLQGFCAVVQALDPDVIVGWDIQQGSLGYLADRGLQLGFNVLRSASKTPEVRGGLGTAMWALRVSVHVHASVGVQFVGFNVLGSASKTLEVRQGLVAGLWALRVSVHALASSEGWSLFPGALRLLDRVCFPAMQHLHICMHRHEKQKQAWPTSCCSVCCCAVAGVP